MLIIAKLFSLYEKISWSFPNVKGDLCIAKETTDGKFKALVVRNV